MTINKPVSPKKPLFAEVHNVPDDYRFTTEELDRIISGDMFTPRQDAIMARELQQYRAAAKPACYALTNSEGEVYNTHSSPENADAYRWLIHQSDDSLTLSVTPLYAAPQVTSVPAVPDGLTIAREIIKEAWRLIPQSDSVQSAAWHTAASIFLNDSTAAPAVQAEPILRDFYSAYGKWIDSGAPEGKPFARCGGLCANLFDYVASTVLEDLHAEFVAAGLDEKLPFNASESEYTDESGRGECHINHARVTWVRARIAAPAVQAEQLSGNTEQVSQPVLPEHSPCVDAPDHIWLQTAGEWPASGEFGELTWSCDNQHPDDTLYVRADLVGKSPGYLQGYKDGCEWSAIMAEANHPQTGDWLFDDPVELAKAIRKGPDMLPAAPDFRGIPNSSTNNCRENADSSTKCWIPVSERLPETDGNYWGWWSESKRQGPVWFIKSEIQAQFQSSEITHWMPLPNPPKQEGE